MNYLAHFYLARKSEKLVLGNFIADFVRGNNLADFESEIEQGIRMHREIDTFTDNHPIVYETKQRLFDTYHKYSGVVVDIYYDHILAKKWENYHKSSLEGFASGIYQTIQKHNELLPKKAAYTFHYMSGGDWLTNYSTLNGIDRTLRGLSRRTRFNSGIESASEELARDYEQIALEFEMFFPELISHMEKFNSEY